MGAGGPASSLDEAEQNPNGGGFVLVNRAERSPQTPAVLTADWFPWKARFVKALNVRPDASVWEKGKALASLTKLILM